jgi:hypothetical protein
MRKNSKPWLSVALGTFSALFAVAVSARAQSESGSKPVPPPQQQGQDPQTVPAEVSNTTNPPAVPTGPTTPINGTPKYAGTAMPWGGTASFLRWGPFSVTSFDYSFVHDSYQPVAPAPAQISNRDLNTFHTNVAFDWSSKRVHFLVQYSPVLTIQNGDVPGTTTDINNSASANVTYVASSRLTMSITDSFVQARTRQFYSSDYLQPDVTSGNVLQNNFLTNGRTYINDSVSAVFGYRWSALTTITVSPQYGYSRTTMTGSSVVSSGESSGASIAVSHLLSASQSIGVMDTAEYFIGSNIATSNQTSNGRNLDNIFNTASVFYARQLSPTWWIQARIGAQASSYGGTAGTEWSTSGGGSLVKKFERSSASLAYDRGRSFSNYYITNQSGDRIDLAYATELFGRLDWRASLGYYRTFGVGPGTQAKYAGTSLGFSLQRDLRLHADYVYRYQNSPSLQLLPGSQNTVIVGISWQPASLRQ